MSRSYSPRFSAVLLSLAALLLTPAGRAEDPGNSDRTSNQAKNLARVNCGARIDRIKPGGHIEVVHEGDQNGNPSALALDDNTISSPLTVGDNTFIVTLRKIAILERFVFINQDAAAEGHVSIAVSNFRLGSKDSKWTPTSAAADFTGKRVVELPMLATEAKYVRLTFHVKREGRVAGIGLYGQRTLESFGSHHILRAQSSYRLASARLAPEKEETLNFNFANRYARAKVAYVSSGPVFSSPRLIDDDVTTAYQFAAQDRHPTIIVELAQRQKLHRVSAVSQMGKGRVEVYVLDEMPADPRGLGGVRPVASQPDLDGSGQTGINFSPAEGRFIVLRWTPPAGSNEPFEVHEIAGFSVVALSLLDLEDEPITLANVSTSKPGEGAVDVSNTLGTIAIPPSLPVVSP